jgi:ERF superfamily
MCKENGMETTKIDAAIAKVAAGVKRLEKLDRNAHGGYNFAGIDDFLAMTGKLCGDAGLSVIMDESDFEIIPDFFVTKGGKTAGLRMKFAIYLRAAGESIGPFHRSIMVPSHMGSQAFGAGQSYVLKQFLRATFQIPTGDKNEDIDAYDTGAMTAQYSSKPTWPEGPTPNKSNGEKAMRELKAKMSDPAMTSEQFEANLSESSALFAQFRLANHAWHLGETSGGDSFESIPAWIERRRNELSGTPVKALIASMESNTTLEELSAWAREHGDTIEGLPDHETRAFTAAYDAHASALSANVAMRDNPVTAG